MTTLISESSAFSNRTMTKVLPATIGTQIATLIAKIVDSSCRNMTKAHTQHKTRNKERRTQSAGHKDITRNTEHRTHTDT